MTFSPSRQKNAVSEGLALGLVLCGVWDLPYNKVSLELAFRRLWRNWQYRHLFPSVTSSMARGLDEIHVIAHATERRHAHTLFWERHGKLSVHARDKNWDPGVEGNVEFVARMICQDVPAEAWKVLMQSLITESGFEIVGG